MYGQIHVCVRSLVLEKFGNDAWQKILTKSKCDETEDFMVFHRYEDSKTFALIGAVSETLGAPLTAVLEIFGEYFFQYCLQNGYDKMLRTLGEDFRSFIQNLDSLHSLLAMSYKNIDAPSFRCDTDDDGNLTLHYYTSRVGLYPIVLGLLRAVGKELFHTDVKAEVIDIQNEATELEARHKANGDYTSESSDYSQMRYKEHVTFRVTLNDKVTQYKQKVKAEELENKNGTTDLSLVPMKNIDFHLSYPESSYISPRNFCTVFPYHVIFDSNLVIKQCGVQLQKCCPYIVEQDVKLMDIFSIAQPKMPLTFQHILRFINATFILELRGFMLDNGVKTVNAKGILLKGQMIWMEDIDHIIFMCSPRLSSLTELLEKNVYLSDIPPYDVTRELVLLNQQRIAEIEISKKLDETTAELKRTAHALEEEKRKTDMLLYQMLPVKVAGQLRDGKKVAAEAFGEVTVLFSDIVTFTNIASACTPLDIVDMLNALYSRFDKLTTEHDVYKVETIGDAYMVVGGVPEPSVTHAEKVANQAIDMITLSREVVSPATGSPLQIRVGVHTGPVVAGVVGEKMPRYCLFGDTVNTASRMESHGLPGRIHISFTTYDLLRDKDYVFEPRGEIQVKGKGRMDTYFLIGNSDKAIPCAGPVPTTPSRGGGKTTGPSPTPQSANLAKLHDTSLVISAPHSPKKAALNQTQESKSCSIL